MNLRTLSVGTFNLYNLNEPGLALYRDRDGWSQSEYERKIEWTQRSIRLLHPDILGFRELRHRASLARALAAAGLSNDYDLLAPEDANGTHIVCAAIVRKGLLLGQPEWIVTFPEQFVLQSAGDDPQTPAISVNITSFSRPVLHFQVRPRADHDPIHVYVCHLKSKNPTEVFREAWFGADTATYQKHQNNLGAALSTIRRTAEAAALRFLLTEQMKGTRTPVIVLGDINDAEQQHRQHSDRATTLSGRRLLGWRRPQPLHRPNPAGIPQHAGCLLHAHLPRHDGVPRPCAGERGILRQ
jgi:predicted extracellular nuclease